MRVDIIPPFGFCFGVKKAIEDAIKIKKENPNKRIFIYGDLVHNKHVMDYLVSENIFNIKASGDFSFDTRDLNVNDILIFSAHGHKLDYEKDLEKRNITFYSTTCKNVKKNLDLIKNNLNRGVIYIGKNNHPESVAALSISSEIIFFDIEKGTMDKKCKYSSPIIINQTTLSILELNDIYSIIKRSIPRSVLSDEICSATRIRQEAIINLSEDYDLVLVVGSKKSSNTTKLYSIIKRNKPKIDCFYIENLEDCSLIDKKNYNNVAIVGGTSTPQESLFKVRDFLEH